MAYTQEQVNDIYKQILDVILIGLDSGNLEAYEATEIAQHIVGKVENLDSNQAKNNFFEEIVSLWPAMDMLLDEQKMDHIEKTEQEASEGAIALLQHGKVDDALNLVKSTTNN